MPAAVIVEVGIQPCLKLRVIGPDKGVLAGKHVLRALVHQLRKEGAADPHVALRRIFPDIIVLVDEEYPVSADIVIALIVALADHGVLFLFAAHVAFDQRLDPLWRQHAFPPYQTDHLPSGFGFSYTPVSASGASSCSFLPSR